MGSRIESPGHPGKESETVKRVWILGAPDPEMEMIERLLRQCGEKIMYATDASGQRAGSEPVRRSDQC